MICFSVNITALAHCIIGEVPRSFFRVLLKVSWRQECGQLPFKIICLFSMNLDLIKNDRLSDTLLWIWWGTILRVLWRILRGNHSAFCTFGRKWTRYCWRYFKVDQIVYAPFKTWSDILLCFFHFLQFSAKQGETFVNILIDASSFSVISNSGKKIGNFCYSDAHFDVAFHHVSHFS